MDAARVISISYRTAPRLDTKRRAPTLPIPRSCPKLGIREKTAVGLDLVTTRQLADIVLARHLAIMDVLALATSMFSTQSSIAW